MVRILIIGFGMVVINFAWYILAECASNQNGYSHSLYARNAMQTEPEGDRFYHQKW